MGLFDRFKKEKPPVAESIQNRQEIIAAVSAVIAEETGESVSRIRIHSFKERE